MLYPAATDSIACCADSASGARPRLVWRITPVALITGLSDGVWRTRSKLLADGTPGPSLACAVIIKSVDAQTRAKTGINELLRD